MEELPLQGQTGHEGEVQSFFMKCEYERKHIFYILQSQGECDQRATQSQSSTEVFLISV